MYNFEANYYEALWDKTKTINLKGSVHEWDENNHKDDAEVGKMYVLPHFVTGENEPLDCPIDSKQQFKRIVIDNSGKGKTTFCKQ